jgi:hypothetical protein
MKPFYTLSVMRKPVEGKRARTRQQDNFKLQRRKVIQKALSQKMNLQREAMEGTKCPENRWKSILP